jgi:hypothetical protein
MSILHAYIRCFDAYVPCMLVEASTTVKHTTLRTLLKSKPGAGGSDPPAPKAKAKSDPRKRKSKQKDGDTGDTGKPKPTKKKKRTQARLQYFCFFLGPFLINQNQNPAPFPGMNQAGTRSLDHWSTCHCSALQPSPFLAKWFESPSSGSMDRVAFETCQFGGTWSCSHVRYANSQYSTLCAPTSIYI